MKKPKLIFIALYRHHCRYFSRFVAEDQFYEGVISRVDSYLWPLWPRHRATPDELETILRYSSKRSANRAQNVFARLFLPLIYGVQRRMASVYFSNYLHAFEEKKIDGIVLWNGQNLPLAAAAAAARRLGIKTIFIENGPLPNTMMVDPQGINYENTLPRTADFYREVTVDSAALSRLLSTPLVQRASRRPEEPVLTTTLPAKFYFLPFQTYSDTQILLFSPWIPDMEQLVRTVSSALKSVPGESIALVAKEHPSCRKQYDALREEMAKEGVLFAQGVSTSELIERSSGVITINSSVGVEALLKNRPVLTLGQAFYNIPGLVLHADNPEELQAGLTKLHTYQPEAGVREGFLYYLRYHYLVEGTHKNPDPHHVHAVGKRIHQLLTAE